VGLLLIGAILVLDAWLLNLLITRGIQPQQISFWTFLGGLVVLVSVPVLLLLIYQTTTCLTLRYHLDRNGIVVRWFGTELILPIGDIQRIVPGRQLGNPIVQRHGLRWPGHERGAGLVPGIGRTQFLATRPLVEQLLLITQGRAYAISPTDLEGFQNAFTARQELGPNRLLEPQVRRASWLTWSFWTDQTAWTLLGAAAAINLGLFAYLCARFPGLDFQLPLHFSSLGQPDRIGTKMELFALPIIGLIILCANLGLGVILYRRERAGSYLLWGAAATVQVLFWLAAFSIVP
jgi:Bacterial PH domain